ncbi:hypothetical protein MBLNU457_5921t1 [Dothideomycetes sp. NU457]
MATESSKGDSLKRKRSQKAKEGLPARHKRIRADGSSVEDNAAQDAAAADEADDGDVAEEVPADAEAIGQVESTGKRRRGRGRGKQTKSGDKVKRALWHLSTPIGGRFVRHDPVFSTDGKYLFTATPNELRICSVEDSLVERTIHLKSGSITAFALSGGNPSSIYIASSDGRVETWNWVSAKKIAEFASGLGKVTSIAANTDPETEEDDVYLVTVSDGIWHIVHDSQQIYTSMMPLSNVVLAAGYIISTAPGRLIVGYGLGEDKHRFMEYRIGTNVSCLAARLQTAQTSQKSQKKGKKTAQDALTIALGSSTGEILMYENVSPKDDSAASALADPRVLHWHRENVEALKWSQDGNYLISGGRETVLVLWQMATGKKQFLPHLMAEIEQITVLPNGASYAIQLADNSVMVLSTSELKPVANFAGLQAQHPSNDILMMQKARSEEGPASIAMDRSLYTPAVIHPIRKNEILLTVPPSMLNNSTTNNIVSKPFLQTFDMAISRHVGRQALSRNKITDFTTGPEGNTILEPDVSLLQVSNDGQWLAVVEEWMPPSQDSAFLASDAKLNEEQRALRKEVYLKIWHWNEVKGQWALETRIDNPHPYGNETKAGAVLALAAEPSDLGFATVGEDGCVRIWTPRRTSGKTEPEDWRCVHAVQLEAGGAIIETNQSSTTTASAYSNASIAYSPDGSLLAVAQSSALTGQAATSPIHFVNTTSGTLVHSQNGLYTGTFTALSFLDKHLIILSTRSLTIYKTVTSSLVHRHDLGKVDAHMPLYHRRRFLAIDAEARTIAVADPVRTRGAISFLPATRLQIFDLSSTKPLYSISLPVIVTALLAVGGRKGFTYLTTAAEIYTLSPPSALLNFPAQARSGGADTETTVAPVADEDEDEDMESALVALDDEDVDEADRAVVRPEDLARLFDTPAVAAGAVPVRSMFEAVVGLFGRKGAGKAVAAA